MEAENIVSYTSSQPNKRHYQKVFSNSPIIFYCSSKRVLTALHIINLFVFFFKGYFMLLEIRIKLFFTFVHFSDVLELYVCFFVLTAFYKEAR